MVTDKITEVIFVGLPGPTHHYGGLSADNVAATINRGSISNPRQAALQALDLMRLLNSLGIITAVLPPQLRPHMPLLRQHFKGDDAAIIRQASFAAPLLLEKSYAVSAMWTANAATVAPGIDCADGKLHITVANLFTHLHRRIEAEDTYRVLKHIFREVPGCVVHPPLSAAMGLTDEGAANHMRFAPTHSDPGLHVFVYGADGGLRDPKSARQTLSASRAVQQQHHIPERQALFLRQNPDVIAQGVFHNDVIAVSNGSVLLVHEQAYDNGLRDIGEIAAAYETLHPNRGLKVIVLSEDDLSVEEAVHTYFFNSQIITRPDGGMAIIAPVETQSLYEGWAAELLDRIRVDPDNPIDEVHIVDLRQSMRNGGGPACLRLRVPMDEPQLEALVATGGVTANERLIDAMEDIITGLYPDELTSDDLGNPELSRCCYNVLERLSEVMQMPLLPEAAG